MCLYKSKTNNSSWPKILQRKTKTNYKWELMLTKQMAKANLLNIYVITQKDIQMPLRHTKKFVNCHS